ncbi:MAG: hypothetical protein ABIN94_07500, partial [Ferruginibacter sp.]
WVVCKQYLHIVCDRPTVISYSALQKKVFLTLISGRTKRNKKNQARPAERRSDGAANKKAEIFHMILKSRNSPSLVQ